MNMSAAQGGRTEGAVLLVRRSAPEHNPYMTSKPHSTTARWIRLGVNFEEGGNRSARRKPSKSGWDWLKLNPHTTFVVEVEGVIVVHYASLASRRVQHRVFYLDGHSSRYQPRPTGLKFGEQTGMGVFPLVIAVPEHHGFASQPEVPRIRQLLECRESSILATCPAQRSCCLRRMDLTLGS